MPFFFFFNWFIFFSLGTLSVFFFLFPAWRNKLASLQMTSTLSLINLKTTRLHPIYTANTIGKWLILLFCHVVSITDPLNEISISTEAASDQSIRTIMWKEPCLVWTEGQNREEKGINVNELWVISHLQLYHTSAIKINQLIKHRYPVEMLKRVLMVTADIY